MKANLTSSKCSIRREIRIRFCTVIELKVALRLDFYDLWPRQDGDQQKKSRDTNRDQVRFSLPIMRVHEGLISKPKHEYWCCLRIRPYPKSKELTSWYTIFFSRMKNKMYVTLSLSFLTTRLKILYVSTRPAVSIPRLLEPETDTLL